MSRKLRFVSPGGSLIEVTCRTIQARLLMRPSPQLELPEKEYPWERRHLFFSEVQERVVALSEVRAAGATNTAPFGLRHPR